MAVKFLIGGSPCTFWSVAQKNNRETEAEGIGWELFKNFLIAKNKFQPDFFLYENNKSAAKPIKDQISNELEVPLQYINSALVSAQNRQRFYAHNILNVPQPKDRGILLKDVLCSDEQYKYIDIKKVLNKQYLKNYLQYDINGKGNKSQDQRAYYLDGKMGCLDTGCSHKSKILLSDGKVRECTINELEMLQTLPKGFTKAVNKYKASKGIGSGWTAEVIIHILKHANVPLDEEIVILSMYDGIGTGRYCFDKMGYKNIKYFATEIDKYAMQISMSNYSDIIQLGDAFQVRNSDWKLSE